MPPTVVTAELAALGHVRGGGPPAQAAFAATGAAVSFLVASANFLGEKIFWVRKSANEKPDLYSLSPHK